MNSYCFSGLVVSSGVEFSRRRFNDVMMMQDLTVDTRNAETTGDVLSKRTLCLPLSLTLCWLSGEKVDPKAGCCSSALISLGEVFLLFGNDTSSPIQPYPLESDSDDTKAPFPFLVERVLATGLNLSNEK